MWFEWFLARRLLWEGRSQTALILAGVSLGVAVTVFLSALIGGLQESLIVQTLGSQPHVVLRSDSQDRTAVFPRDEQAEARLAGVPGVLAVSPVLTAPAFARSGETSKPVQVRGVLPDPFTRVVELASKVKAGQYAFSGKEAVIGSALAEEMGLSVGDSITLSTADGSKAAFTITGLFDIGNKEVNRSWALVPLAEAQELFQRTGSVSSLELKVTEIFQADQVAAQAADVSGLSAESWSQANAQLLTALQSQSASSYTIQFFVIMAVALGIASVLVVSVVQKSKEIGILRAMGASTGRVLRVFLIQGGLLGLTGSLLGSLMGAGLSVLFISLVTTPEGEALFAFSLEPALFIRSALVATAVGLLSAVAPARRASNLQPATVIRYG